MWTCVNCGEANLDTADSCEVCARPSGPPTPAPPIGTPPAAPVPARSGPFPAMWPARWVLAAAVAVLVLAGAIVIPRLDRTDRTDRPTAADGISAVTETGQTDPGEVDTEETDAGQGGTGQSGTGQSGGEAAPTDGTAPVGGPQPGWTQGEAAGGAAPTGAGIVSLAADATDSRTLEVARMFDTYFSGINDKDYDTVGSVLDPAGPVDPGNAREMAALARGTRSTRDSEVALTALADLGDSRLRAEVTFRSDQDPGDGPKGRTAETCTRWDIDYTLSSAGGTYRILRGEATSQPC